MKLHVVILWCVLSSAVALAGPEFDRARRNTAIARNALDAAERTLELARTNDDKVRLEMDRIRDKQRDIDRELDRLRDVKRDLPEKVRAEEAGLPQLEDAVKTAAEEAAKLQGPLRERIDAAKETLAAVKAVRAKYVKQFEISEAYQHAVIRAELAAKFQAATHRAVMERTWNSPSYKAAETAHRAARGRQAAVKLNTDAPAADRIAAANLVIETESAMMKIEQDALAGDESLTGAKADSAKTAAKLKSLIEQFERDLPRQPDMVDAQEAHVKAQAAADAADAALTRAVVRLTAATDALTSGKSAIVKHKEAQVATEMAILAALREADDHSRQLDRLTDRLQDAGAALTRAQRELDLAERRYREARANEIVAARIDAQNSKN